MMIDFSIALVYHHFKNIIKNVNKTLELLFTTKGNYMLRNPYAIKHIYGLDEVKRNPTQAQDDVVTFLKGLNDGYNTKHWNFPRSMTGDYNELSIYADHEDFLKNNVTFLPYADLDDIQDVINNHPRWKLAQQYGLHTRVEPARKEIFEGSVSCQYIIIISCVNWNALRNDIRKDIYTQWEESWTLD